MGDKKIRNILDDCRFRAEKYNNDFRTNFRVGAGLSVLAGAVPTLNILYAIGNFSSLKSPVLALNVLLLGSSIWLYRFCEYDNGQNRRTANDFDSIRLKIDDHLKLNTGAIDPSFQTSIESEYDTALRRASFISEIWK